MDESLGQSAMNNDSLPTATSPRPPDDVEVLSQRALNQGEIVLAALQGGIPDARRMGGKTPVGSNDGGSKFGPQPDTAPEPLGFQIQAGSPSLRGASRLCR